MKNLMLPVLALLLVSCNREAVTGRVIDQNLVVYIDSLGTDLLNPEQAHGYKLSQFTDVLAPRDGVIVNMAPAKDAAGKVYLAYTAGATRIIKSTSTEGQLVQSVIAMNFGHKTTTPQRYPVTDTLILNYLYNDQVFRIQSALYNRKPVLSKTAAGQNVISVSK